MTYRLAATTDIPLLSELNAQLIEDEKHRSRLSTKELAPLLRQWLAEGYRAVVFEKDAEVVAYALYRPEETHHPGEVGIYLRQFFVCREHRREGAGREAMRILEEEIWPRGCRVSLEVLVGNTAAREFWKSLGFHDYTITLEKFGG